MRAFLLLLVCLLAFAPASSAKDSADQPVIESTETFRGFTLQVAAFNTRAEAERFAKDLPKSWIAEATVQGKVYFRVNFGRFASRSLAVAGQWNLEDIVAELPAGRVPSEGVVVSYNG
jgi:septal ring-binding cell division protein DamX